MLRRIFDRSGSREAAEVDARAEREISAMRAERAAEQAQLDDEELARTSDQLQREGW
ncbi:hypothetical protein [Nonomuraea helvata]|uniref:Uncharacterized protein n=1 Tax=Nonomuraea helvata TaxID=37484 RepID=A0ABV5S610_9ACTN